MVLDGKDGVATLSRSKTPGEPPTTVSGRKILYNRTTGETRIIGVDSLRGETVPQPGKK